MYFNVNFNVFFSNKKVYLLLSELYRELIHFVRPLIVILSAIILLTCVQFKEFKEMRQFYHKIEI